MRNHKRPLPGNASGFLLIEVTVAMVLLSIITIGVLTQYRDYLTNSFARAQGEQLRALNQAVSKYSTEHFDQIVNTRPITGVADAKAPTVQELAAIGYLNAAFSPTNMYGSNYAISLSLSPAACIAPACNIQGLVYMTGPISLNGVIDTALLGEAMLAAGGDAGFSSPLDPANITGFNGSWTVANPLGNTPGILAMRNGYDSSALSVFVRRDGTLPMTGTLNMDKHSIRTNDKTVIADDGTLVINETANAWDNCTADQIGQVKRTPSGQLLMCGNNVTLTNYPTSSGDPVCNSDNGDVGQVKYSMDLNIWVRCT